MALTFKNKVFLAVMALFFALTASAQSERIIRQHGPTVVSPREASARVAVYLWGYLPPAEPADNGWVLVSAAKRAKALGAKVVRIAVSSCYSDPQGTPSGEPIDQLVEREDYNAVLNMFDTVIVTAYDLASCDLAAQTPIYRERLLTADELAAVRGERMRFVDVVAIRHPNTKVIVANWESDHDVMADDQGPAYIAYTKTWLMATRDEVASLRQSGLGADVETMVEMDYPVPLAGVEFNGLAVAVTDLAPNGQPLWDFISYSSWESMMYGVDPRVNAESYAAAFDSIYAACSAAGFSCDDKVVVGEVGTLRNYDPGERLLNSAVWESMRQNARYVVNWVLADQPGLGVMVDGVFYDQSQFGNYDASGIVTSQGLDVARWFVAGILAPDENPERIGRGPSAHAVRGFRPRHPMDAR
jgi:hypothetical protein